MFEVVSIVLILLVHSTDASADCGSPTYSLYADQSCNELGSITPPNPTTVGALVQFSCASLLIRTKAAIDYCPVMVCEDTGVWSKAGISCGGATECFNSSQAYEGRRNCTVSGKMCQSWNSQSPHPHSYTNDEMFPHDNLTESGSYCRDPDGTRGSPWCYTTDPGVEWETCGIPDCTSITVGQGQCENNYCGDPLSTISVDNGCTLLVVVSDGSRNVGSTIEYRCNSWLTGFSSAIDYCPVKRCQLNTFWTNAYISCGVNECYNTGQSQLYQGRRTCTETGKTCQRWDSQSPNSHSYTANDDYPDPTVSAAGSYCRDPGSKGQPWCYTTTAGEWEYCGVLTCASLSTNFGSCATTAAPSTTSTLTPTTTSTTTSTITTTSASTSTTPPATEALSQSDTEVTSSQSPSTSPSSDSVEFSPSSCTLLIVIMSSRILAFHYRSTV